VLLGKPNVYGSIFRFEGQATVFDARQGPCYRCLFPEPPPPGMVPSCAEGGVLGVLPGMIAMIQATEAIKIITGKGTTLVGRLLQYDSLGMRFREFRLRKDPKCPVCGEHPTVKELIDYEGFCGLKSEETETPVPEISPVELKGRLGAGADFLLLDVREPREYEIARIPGSTLIPLGDLPNRLAEMEAWRDREVVIHCKSGARSGGLGILMKAGFGNVKNLTAASRNGRRRSTECSAVLSARPPAGGSPKSRTDPGDSNPPAPRSEGHAKIAPPGASFASMRPRVCG
jgi:adenylyltransferase/sulfurtransferase